MATGIPLSLKLKGFVIMEPRNVIPSIDDTPLVEEIFKIKSALRIELVNRTGLEALWNQLVKLYHYLGYNKTIGARVKYLVWFNERPIAAISYNQASYRVGVRDTFIDWNDEERKKYLPHVLNNNRLLILPWVHVKNLASHLIALSIKHLKHDWPLLYGVEPYLLETFVDQDKYKGTCYRAANWHYVGETSGFGKVGITYQYHGNKKGVYLYPLKKNYKQLMGCTGRHKPLRVLKKSNKYLEMVSMQLQKNTWHEGILEEAKVPDIIDKLPEMFNNYINRFADCFKRAEPIANLYAYTRGLLSNLERKSVGPIALEFIDNPRGPRNLQNFMKNAQWDEEKAIKIYQEGLSERISDDEGMLTVDESGFVKKGKHSVGVARQYCGSVGKVENSQVGVFVGYSGHKGYGLISTQLFMPEKWFGEDYTQRRQDCAVPDELTFRTKPQIALDLIRKIEESELFKAKWIGMDCLYGNSKEFLDAISDKYWYFADIHNNTQVWRTQPTFKVPEYKGRGPRPTIMAATTPTEHVSKIAGDETIPWVKMYLGEGSKGPIHSDIKCLQIYRAFAKETCEVPRKSCWLFIRRSEEGVIRYSISNAPVDIPTSELCKASLMRWPIEQCFNEAKDELGMDHYEFRSWTAWHRHMLLVSIASSFLLEIRLQVIDKKKVRS
ncbi:IS701 family transposase [Dehalobacterium formicoaceticum]|uniref:IS701 family transposase n=2 Tax=Dehalobacterium formicoaceticum TaxID=51515 RepID=A0ABT1Y6S4_9FIRM|nr:IS701 family transposase [Dehalobacterium formicoaceticum]MCR6546589.1 IS701 family transposase [Dehalobacterium formicoaceticum]